MKLKHKLSFGIAICTASLLVGCYESPDVTMYEPGVYKGIKDPLLAKSRTIEHEKELNERMLTVQTDR